MSDWQQIPVERLHYYTGRPLTARDLEDEQRYHLERGRWRNRIALGSGVVCGFGVKHHDDPDCAAQGWLIVDPGTAVDGLGRELILNQSRPIPTRLETDTLYRWFVQVCYAERKAECAPGAPPSPCADSPAGSHARVKEDVEISIVKIKASEVWRYGWLEAGHPVECCPSGDFHCLLIAELTEQLPGCRPKIGVNGVRKVPPRHACLTRIEGTNWTHGGEMSLADLREQGLVVKFSAPLRVAPSNCSAPPPYGVSEATFLVSYSSECQVRTPVHYPSSDPPQGVGCHAHYKICGSHVGYLARRVVWVEIHCDLILDHNGYPVDGHPVVVPKPPAGMPVDGESNAGNGERDKWNGGVLTTGRQAGGTFRSWFYVTDEPMPATQLQQGRQQS